MKKDDVKIGMKVTIPKTKSANPLWDPECAEAIVRARKLKQDFLYVIRRHGSEIFILNAQPTKIRGSSVFMAQDFEPYEEEAMDSKLKRIQTIEKELAELKAQVEAEAKPKKDWPDSHEEAMNISRYWGLLVEGKKYLICPQGSAQGLAISANGTWSNVEYTGMLWKVDSSWERKFIPFGSAKALYKWMAE